MRAQSLRSRLSEIADEDSEAYGAFMAERTAETRARIVAVPREIASCADAVAALAGEVRSRVRGAVVGDADAAAELARAASVVARRLADLNE